MDETGDFCALQTIWRVSFRLHVERELRNRINCSVMIEVVRFILEGDYMPQQRQHKIESALQFVGAICFLSLFFPCFLGPLAQADSVASLTPTATWVGCIAGGVIAMLASLTPTLRTRYASHKSMVVHGVLLLCACLPSLLSLFSITPTLEFLSVCDFLRGFSLVALGAKWTTNITERSFGRLLAGISAASLVAILIDSAQVLIHNGGALVLAAGAIIPLLRTSAAQPTDAPEQSESVSASIDVPQDVHLSASPHTNDTTPAPLHAALPSFLRLIGSSTLGFALLVVLSQAEMQLYLFDNIPIVPLGIVVGALVFIVIAMVLREELTIPFAQWILFPLISAILLVLDSFPISSGFFRVGSVSVFLFFAMLGLFAVALLVKANGQGELSPSLTTGLSFAAFALAAWLGRGLVASGLELDSRGALLLPLATVYMVFLLVSPAFRLWREVRGGTDSERTMARDTQKVSNRDEAHLLDERCDAVAASAELSPREAEVLKLAARGYTSTYISKTLFISDSTVRTHLKSIYRKMGVNSKVELINAVRGDAEAGATA